MGVYASAPPVLSSKHVQPISLEPVTHKICVSEEENVLVTPPDTSPRIAFSSRDHIEVLESRFSDDAEHEERPTSKRSRPKRSQQIDWGARLREKIDLFKVKLFILQYFSSMCSRFLLFLETHIPRRLRYNILRASCGKPLIQKRSFSACSF